MDRDWDARLLSSSSSFSEGEEDEEEEEEDDDDVKRGARISWAAFWATAVMIREPPDAPMDRIRRLSWICSCSWFSSWF